MSKSRRVMPILRSLVGQMTLLSLALLLLALAYFVFFPILTRDPPEPLERTISLLGGAVFQVMADSDGSLSDIREAEDVLAAAEANEHFRLYVTRGDEELQIGAPPRWADVADYSQFVMTDPGAAPSGANPARSLVYFRLSESDGETSVSYQLFEGEQVYYEIGGVQKPIAKAETWLGGMSPIVFWWQSRNMLIAGGAIFAGVLMLLVILRRSLRRLADVARTLDPQDPSHELPEKGLPTEIKPMVRAINRMIRRIDEANEEQAFFLAAAAHELRTPLAIVRTRLENLPEGPDKEELKNDLRRMSRLVDQLLRLMSVRNKGKPSETVDLVSIAKSVVAERAPLIIDKGVEIDLDADGQPVEVRGDERLLKVALANLVDNALSFSDPGRRLMVQVSPDRNITVRDEGPGIPQKELDNIFRPFAKNPPNRPGHGLGLAITRSIMALHGGSVDAANLQDGGASFALQF